MLCIFDLDGTLLNTIADLGVACNYALHEHGFPVHRTEDYPHLVGNGVNKLIERALPDGHKDEATILKLRESFIPYYNTHNMVYTKPYEGIAELIQTLKAKGHTLAVASNKYQQATTALVEHYFGVGTFDIILGERIGCPRKPDPQIVKDIVERAMSVQSSKAESRKAKECCAERTKENTICYIGDSDVDMQTAANAKSIGLVLCSIACTWGFCSEETLIAEHPDYIVHTPEEIEKLLISDKY